MVVSTTVRAAIANTDDKANLLELPSECIILSTSYFSFQRVDVTEFSYKYR